MQRVLIVGGGSIGERHLRCFLKAGPAAVALCEPNDELRQRLQKTYHLGDGAFQSLDDVPRSQYDVAVIATPAPLHIPLASRLIAGGRCHVLIEKPLSTSVEGIAELAQQAAQGNCSIGVAYVSRHNPGLQAMRDALLSERYGRPLQVNYVGGQDFPFYRPAYREIYYRDRATGGGAIQDALTHTINSVQWLVGPARAVAADAAHLHLDGVEVEDTVHVLARHQPAGDSQPDVLASYALNQHQVANESCLTVVCTEGMVRWQAHANRWSTIRRGDAEWQHHGFEFARDDGFIAQAAAFLTAAEQGQPPASDLIDGWQTLLTNLALLEAADTRRWVDVPLAGAAQ